VTQDEIIAIAKEAGCIPRRHPEYWDDVQIFATPDVLQAFAKLVAAKEREACAKICETLWNTPTNGMATEEKAYGDECAAAIRTKGKA